jgi:hypothetical protein
MKAEIKKSKTQRIIATIQSRTFSPLFLSKTVKHEAEKLHNFLLLSVGVKMFCYSNRI